MIDKRLYDKNGESWLKTSYNKHFMKLENKREVKQNGI